MADFEDITGWREELERFYEEGGQKAVDYMYRDGPDIWHVKPRLSQVLEYAELMMKFKELRDANAEFDEWKKIVNERGYSDPDLPEWETRPVEARALLNDFYEWYCLKSGFPHERPFLRVRAELAVRHVLRGRYESLRSKACIDAILSLGYIVADEEGTS